MLHTKKILSGAGLLAAVLAVSITASGNAQALVQQPTVGAGTVEQLDSVVDRASGQATGDAVAPDSLSAGVKVGELTVRPLSAAGEAVRNEGRAYYKGVSGSTTVVQGSENETQFITVSKDENSPKEFSYEVTVPADTSAVIEDGSVNFLKRQENLVEVVATTGLPWAKDATGKVLPTHYELQGNRITQYIDTNNAIYPVVADPRFTFGVGTYFNMTGAEAAALISTLTAIGGVAAITTCTLADFPAPVAKVLKVLCQILPLSTVKAVISAYKKVFDIVKKDGKSCFQQRVFPTMGKVKKVAKKNCA